MTHDDGTKSSPMPAGRPGDAASAEVNAAESALHQRMTVACTAATDAGLPGVFRAWKQGDLRAVLATDPALVFLSTVSGVTPENLTAAIDVMNDALWPTGTPTLLVADAIDHLVGPALRAADLRPTGNRVLAVRRLHDPPRRTAHRSGMDIIDADDGSADDFCTVLLAGYEVDGMVADFIGAEHRHPKVRRYFALEHSTPIAAAAMTVHDEVAVLGGAATLPSFRGRGAQSSLLQHRLLRAAGADCSMAVATARPDSASERNLITAGFSIHRETLWRKHLMPRSSGPARRTTPEDVEVNHRALRHSDK